MAGRRARSSGSMPCRIGHLGQAAALAAALEPDPDPAVLGAGDGHVAAVGGDRRVDLGVQDPAGGLGKIRRRPGRRSGRAGAGGDQPDGGDLRARRRGSAASMRAASGSAAPGDPVTSRVTTPSAPAAATRMAAPRAMTDGRTLRSSAAVTCAARSRHRPASRPAASGAVPLAAASSAAPRSAIRSPGASMPTDRRSRSSGHWGRRALAAAPVLDQALHPAQRGGPLEHPDLAQHRVRAACPAGQPDGRRPAEPAVHLPGRDLVPRDGPAARGRALRPARDARRSGWRRPARSPTRGARAGTGCACRAAAATPRTGRASPRRCGATSGSAPRTGPAGPPARRRPARRRAR